MSVDWAEVKLNDLAEITMGQSPKSEFYNFDGIGLPFFQGCSEFGELYPKEKKYCSKPTRLAKSGDILMSVRAPVGDLNIANKECCIGRGVCSIRSKSNDRFVYYLLKANLEKIQTYSSGSTYQSINKKETNNLPLFVPPLPTQRKIAGVLSAYDDLIENNTRRIAILEEMAQRIYKEWFVDFKYPGHENDTLVDSELGPIPEGWEVKKLLDVAEITDCLHSKKPTQLEKGNNLYLHVWNIGSNGQLDLSKKSFITDEDYKVWTKRIEVKNGDCIITKTGRVGAVAKIPNGMKASIGRNIVAIRWLKHPIYLFEYLLSPHKEKEILRLRSSGTVMESIHVAAIEKFLIQIPVKRILDEFETKVGDIQNLIEDLTKQNQTLRQTRDLLLPKLISGKVDVSELGIEN